MGRMDLHTIEARLLRTLCSRSEIDNHSIDFFLHHGMSLNRFAPGSGIRHGARRGGGCARNTQDGNRLTARMVDLSDYFRPIAMHHRNKLPQTRNIVIARKGYLPLARLPLFIDVAVLGNH